eukprot:6948505-Karenia_brevis.AAC.1
MQQVSNNVRRRPTQRVLQVGVGLVGLAPLVPMRIWRQQLVPLTEEDWLQGPQGTLSLKEAYEKAGIPIMEGTALDAVE